MQQTVPFDLKNRITAALTNSNSELWFPHLTCDLMQNGLQQLYNETEITEADYGTARVILKDANAERVFEEAIFTRNDLGEIKNETFVEMLPANIIEQYKELGVDFYTREELQRNKEITNCLRVAFEIIRLVPSLFTTIRHLVKSIHLIKPEGDDYDVSFSEPHIPFSIFVSVPGKSTPINALRVAEAIVHEAMHLQLTLIENIVLLVVPGGKLYYSPWKEENRMIQGVLHGVYVFCVVKKILIFLYQNNFDTDLAKHMRERLRDIEEQLLKVHSFTSCCNLTENGRFLAERLINT